MTYARLSKPENQAAVSRSGLNKGKVLQRKCACGGRCDECSRKKQLMGLQTKLKISEPGDTYEREADRVADQVMTAQAPSALTGAPPRIQRLAGQAAGSAGAEPASVKRALAGSGRPLGPELRRDFEPRFGYDFSKVRLHTGAAAEHSAREVNAHAYTVGQDVVFGHGQYAPGTSAGRRLLAHELTHVVQQSAATERGVPQRQATAEHAPHIQLSGASRGLLQRQPATQTAADYEKLVQAGTWCRDSEKSGQLHDPNLQCYREIPPAEGYAAADQVCFDKQTGKFVESSPDFISAVSGVKPDGTCDIPLGITDPPHPFSKRGRRALGHGIADVCAEDPRMCGRIFGGLSGVAMGIALPKDGLGFGLGTLAIPSILGFLGGALAGRGLHSLDRLARRHGFLPTISLGFGSNIGLSVGTGLEKRDRPLPVIPINTYLTFSFDSSLAVKDESSFLAKVGIRIDPGKQGGVFALGSVGAGLGMGSNVSGVLSGDIGIGIRATDFLDVQVVHETLVGGEGGGTYWLTLKLVAPQRVLKGH
jgi:hypothetical protein